MGDGPWFRRPLPPRQDQHGGDAAQAAGPTHSHAEPQLHPAGSTAEPCRHQWPYASMCRLQQDHQVRLELCYPRSQTSGLPKI